MQFTVLRAHLIRALQLICSAGPRLQAIQLPQTLMEHQKGLLTFWNSDGTSQLQISLPTASEGSPGRVALSAKKLFDLCRVLPEEQKLDISVAQDRIDLSSCELKVHLAGAPGESVLLIPDFVEEVRCELEVAKLKQLLNRVCFAMAQQDVRHYLNGLLLTLSKDTISAVATDGHRLAYGSEKIAMQASDCLMLLPRKSVLEWMKFLEFVTTSHCTLSFGEQTVAFYGDGASFKSQLMVAAFPSYAAALQTPLPYHCLLSVVELKQALLRAMALAVYEKPRKITFSIQKNGLRLTTVNTQQEKIEEQLPLHAVSMEEEVTMGFDIRYLLDVLQALKGDQLKLSFRSPSHLVKFQSSDEEGYEVVVMPMLL